MKKVLIDTNLLVLLIAGALDSSLIGRHRRLRAFTNDDFRRLAMLAHGYPVHVSVPNVLTEASNFLGASDQQMIDGGAEALRHYVRQLDEVYQPSHDVMDDAAYSRFGLADAAILRTALSHDVEVLTSEYALHNTLTFLGAKSTNLRHFA